MIDLKRESWLIYRLGEHGRRVHDGVTDPTVRAERVRAAILEHGLAEVIVGRGQDGKPVTYRQGYEATYGEPLEQPTRRRA